MPDTLTDLFVKNLKPKDKEYTKREKGGFGIRVLPSGRKVFFYLYRIDGQRRFLNLGTYKTKEYPDGITLADARTEYEAERAKVKALKTGRSEGADPLQKRKDAAAEREEHRAQKTVSELVNDYIEKHAKVFKRSWETDEYMLNRDVVPYLGKLKAVDVKKKDIIAVLDRIMERGAPGMANNCFQIIRKMFNWAVEKDILEYTPCYMMKLPAPKKSKERALSEKEIKVAWHALDKVGFISDGVCRALKLTLVTCQRPGEVAGMHTREIDGRWWTIPVERQKVPKSKEAMRAPHRVYLSDLALELIGDTTGKDYIFPTPKKSKGGSIAGQALTVAVSRFLASPAFDEHGKPVLGPDGTQLTFSEFIGHFTPHDLRRTGSTGMAEMRVADEVIDAVLNHVKQGIIKVYNQYKYDKEKQMALEAWGRKMRSILSGKPTGKVVQIKRVISE